MGVNSKILLLGSTGLLGTAFYEILSKMPEYELVAPSRNELNLLVEGEVVNFIEAVKPKIIINCAGYNNVDLAEDDTAECELLNVKLPTWLSAIASRTGGKLIQFSSDYVFDGQNSAGYLEDDPRGPLNKYGYSKAMGEQPVIELGHYVVRISWLFGSGKDNFVTKMLELTETNNVINVVNDQFGKPTYTTDVVHAVLELIDADEESGVYHLPNEGVASWYDFAKEVFTQSGKDVTVAPVSGSNYGRAAERPNYSALINSKRPKLRNWREALSDYLNQI